MKNLCLGIIVLILALLLPGQAPAVTDCREAEDLSRQAARYFESLPEHAVDLLNQATDLCPDSAALQFNRGMALYTAGRLFEAETAFDRALTLNPDYGKALNAMAWLLFTNKAEEQTRAVRLARRAVQLDPDNREFQSTLREIEAFFDVDVPPQTAVRRPHAVAVVIGNRDYEDAMLESVKYAKRDAESVKNYLVRTMGFRESNIIELTNARYIDLVKTFGDDRDHRGALYSRTRKQRSDIFIFYSGHGAPDTNTGQPYIVPADADPNAIRFTGYSLATMYDNLARLSEEKKPRSMTIVMDACFSGGWNEGMLVQNASPLFVEVKNPVLNIDNAVLFMSSKGNQISSWYPEVEHGLFTYFFLKSLKNGINEKRAVTPGYIEKTLLGTDGVNDLAWRLYNREQVPQVLGNKQLVLVPGE